MTSKNIQQGDLLEEKQLIELVGENVFDELLDCGLGQVGELYIGRNIIDSLTEAAQKNYKKNLSNPYLRNKQKQKTDTTQQENFTSHQPKPRNESEIAEEEHTHQSKPSIRKAVRDELKKCRKVNVK